MCFDTTRIHKAGTHPGYVTADKAFPGLGQSLLVSHGRPYPAIPAHTHTPHLQGRSSRDAGKLETGTSNFETNRKF